MSGPFSGISDDEMRDFMMKDTYHQEIQCRIREESTTFCQPLLPLKLLLLLLLFSLLMAIADLLFQSGKPFLFQVTIIYHILHQFDLKTSVILSIDLISCYMVIFSWG